MAEVYDFIPEAEGDEALYLAKLLTSLDDENKKDSLMYTDPEEKTLRLF